MARNKDKSDGLGSKKPSDTSHPWIPVWVALVPHLCGALDAVIRHVAALQERQAAPGHGQILLTIALSFGTSVCSFSWWSAMRGDPGWRGSSPGRLERWVPFAIVAVSALWFVPLRFLSADAADAVGSPKGLTDQLTIDCDDEHVESISYFDLELERGPRAASGSYPFSKQLTRTPKDIVVAVTRARGASSWTQLVVVRQCQHEGKHVRCKLPELDWSPAHFLGPQREENMINRREILMYGPSDSCESLAGKSLSAGLHIFSSTPTRTTVMRKQRGQDLAALDGTHIAVVGDYDSHATAVMLEECAKLGPLGCGPHLTFSSASALRNLPPGAKDPADPTPRLFRLTTDNHSRARDLVDELERHASVAGTDQIVIAYNDDSDSDLPGQVYYALDQARELEKALHTSQLAAAHFGAVRWIRFRYGGREGPRRLSFSEGTPDEAGRPLEVTTFQQLVRSIRSSSGALKRVIFIDRDIPIVEFGHAIQAEYARTRSTPKDVVWYVPGPREVVAGVWNKCFDVPRTKRDLEGIVVLGPDGPRDTNKAREFEQRWRRSYPHEPLAPRAARMYDALAILETAVRELDHDLLENERYLDVHAYRRELRKRIAGHPIEGASGWYVFDELGDLQAPNHVGERHPSGELDILLLPSPSAAHTTSDTHSRRASPR